MHFFAQCRLWFRATRRVAALAAAACLLCSGCVTRRLTIRTDPPGATVFIDDYEVGVTPVSVPYTYYGTRKVVLVMDGFETRTVMQALPAPYYQYVPLDFVYDNVIPWEIRDERTVEYKLLPQLMVQPEEVRQRGEQLRQSVQGGAPLNGALIGRPPDTAPAAEPAPVQR